MRSQQYTLGVLRMAKDANLTIRFSGADRLIRKAERIGGEIKSDVRVVIRKYTLIIERTAKKLAPVDTGRLRSSIRGVLRGMVGEVLTDVEYAPFQEFGTGRRGAMSGTETPSGYEYGPSAGIAPNSFLRPALERHAQDFVREVRDVIRKHA